MRKFFSALFVFTLFISVSKAQDIITKKTGEDILAKILEVTSTEVKYKKHDNPDGPTFSSLISDILMIRYDNGTKDIFDQEKTKVSQSSSLDLDLQGRRDALANYSARNTGKGWTAATTILFSPLFGIIPAAACAGSRPKDQNLDYPDPELMMKGGYRKAYIDQAHKTKKRKVWQSFGISSGIWVVLYLVSNSQ